MLKLLAKGLFGRFLSYAAISLGFWLLYQGFSRPTAVLAVLGGGVVLLGMYLMVQARKSDPSYRPTLDDNNISDPVVGEKNPTGREDAD